MVGIARRLKETFPKLLNDLKGDDYYFYPVFGSRMLKSAKGFVDGLQNKDLVIQNVTTGYDSMSPHTSCENYLNDVIADPSMYEEAAKYRLHSEYLNTKRRIEEKLDMSVTDNEITAFYDLCRFAWEGILDKPNPWCALFTTEDLEVLEYLGDIQHYYRNSYGNAYGAKLGQLVLADILKRFELAKNLRGKKIVANFGRSSIMDMMFVALDLFHDENPLTGAYRDVNRKWRSVTSTFGANFIVTLNKCKSGDVPDYQVAFYLNEKPLSALCNEGVCSWQEFEDKFKPFLNTTTDFCN
ncbi:multiple inositol polyphosphate phosphatase 1-like [Anticarsia gemmatalis]|uniref:multiple inositol polyphosphate phosphatase 1-like n=1 Tax=Anticarsia gemmatalis TaxID=129554 RepID=UPI003F773581